MKSIFLTLVVLFLSVQLSNAQWQPDVRLTNDPAGSSTCVNNARCIAVNGGFLHVVWYDNRDGNAEIYYKRSTDGGTGWGADTRLTNASNDSWHPCVSVSAQVVHVVWMDRRDGNYEIYYKRSIDGGISWAADTRLTNNTAISGNPSISVSDQVLHVVWQDSRDGSNEVYYKRSTDGGVSWGADIRLTNAIRESLYSSVSVSGQVVHVVWMDNRYGLTYDIHYIRSTDGGISWEADIQLTNDPDNSVWPSVSVSGQVVHVVWYDYRDGNAEIYNKHSSDGGISWGADTRLTNAPGYSQNPSVSVSGQAVHVVWQDLRNGNPKIFYKRSTDGGINWEADTQLTNDPVSSHSCNVSASGAAVHVVWSDGRDGNYEIYYKRNLTGNPVGITNINPEIPNEFSLHQNYPNPFNPTTKIKFSLPNPSEGGAQKIKLVVYDVLGREVVVLVNEQLQPGTYEVEWPASNYPSGVYYYKLSALEVSGSSTGEGSASLTTGLVETKKMVLIK